MPGVCAYLGQAAEVLTIAATDRLSFVTLLDKLYTDKHTGPIVLHFAQGVPNAVEFPSEPVRVPLTKRDPRA